MTHFILCISVSELTRVASIADEPGMFIGLIAQGNASREYYGYVDKVIKHGKHITSNELFSLVVIAYRLWVWI